MDTEKLYSPVNLFLRDSNMLEYYDENNYWRDELSHDDVADYLSDIELAVRRDRDTLDKNRGMMEYYDSGSVNDKVHSLFPNFEYTEGKLWCVAELTLTAPLTEDEMSELKDWWSGQLSDGWGEGFEQHAIMVRRRDELYIEPWTSDKSFFVDTSKEFEKRFDLEQPMTEKPSVLAQIRETAKEAKTRPPKEKAEGTLKKHEPEL